MSGQIDSLELAHELSQVYSLLDMMERALISSEYTGQAVEVCDQQNTLQLAKNLTQALVFKVNG